MSTERYPSDLTDKEWEVLEALVQEAWIYLAMNRLMLRRLAKEVH